MMTLLTAGWLSAKPTARSTRDRPCSSASFGEGVGGGEFAPVLRRGDVEAARDQVGAGGCGLVGADPVLAGEPPGRRGAVADDAHAVLPHDREDLAFDAADEQGVRQLLGVRGDQAVLLGEPVRLDELVRGEDRGAVVADLPLADQVVEGLEGLQEVGVRVGPVGLVEVDVVGVEAAQAVLDGADDPAPRVAGGSGSSPIWPWNLVARKTSSRRPLRALPDDLLGGALAVDVGGVDRVDARRPARRG